MCSTGSCLHSLRALRYPRWEDYNYERLDADQNANRLFWLGDGMTLNEKTMSGDSMFTSTMFLAILFKLSPLGAWYLDNDWIDPPPGRRSSQKSAGLYLIVLSQFRWIRSQIQRPMSRREGQKRRELSFATGDLNPDLTMWRGVEVHTSTNLFSKW